MNSPSILFICTANICRSPMAEALFRAHLREMLPENWHSWRVESAGTWANDGEQISANSQQALVARGLSLKDHQSRTVTAEMLEQFDLILTMESGHKESIQVEFPGVARRVFLLSEMSGGTAGVSDPFGRPLEAYQRTAALLERLIEKGFARITDLVLARQV